MSAPNLVSDTATRDAVRNDLNSTLFVEASAGSGKTTCLVDRFVALVKSGVPADHIAAITFTEKAGAELVDRVRARLQREGQHSSLCRDGLRVLDGAAIGTLHSFAQRILTAHPIEAGLPPSFALNDEIASQVAFDSRWEQFADWMLEDQGLETPLRLLFASGGKPQHLRDVAVAFNANWDLVAERYDGFVPDPIRPVDVSAILTEVVDLVALSDHCTDASDLMYVHLKGRVTDFETRIRQADNDEERLRALTEPKLAIRRGQRGNWPNIDLETIRQRLAAVDTACGQLRNGVLEAVLQVVGSTLATFTIDSAHARRAAGELEFHDLLVLARNLLRDAQFGFEVRQTLTGRYQRLMLDEFQDTDPIQIDIAALIASDDPDARRAHWSQIDIKDGRLFFVGDPKQSIYRFRRADIAMFLKARDQLVGSSRTLSQNFRTGGQIVEWVNATFTKIIVAQPDSQPEYQPLIGLRADPEVGPAVAFIGRQHEARLTAQELREAEAVDVAATIRRVLRESWSVSESQSDGDNWRPARWRDIAVLLPARTSLPFLERALEDSEIPYRAETSSLVYGTREVRDLMTVLRAIEDPTDELAVVSALRTPGFGCGDDDLVTWKRQHFGRWDHQQPFRTDSPIDHPVAQGLVWMAEQYRQRRWLTASELVDRTLRDRRFFELAAADQRPRDLWRRLRFVLDQCRAWEEAGGNTLRRYLRWVDGQSSEGSRVLETVLPETDDDAVRILTIHGAKGLEFPVTILSGLTTENRSAPRGVEVRFPSEGGVAVRLSKQVSTSDFEAMQAAEEQMGDNERRRLAYVAATRARDHLVVSVHRNPSGRPTTATLMFNEGWDPDQVELLDVADEPPVRNAVVPSPVVGELPSLDEWRGAHEAALKSATRPVATSATRLAAEAAAARESDEVLRTAEMIPGLAKQSRDLDLPAWQKGRYGSAVGRAVHAVLQVVDLDAGVGLAAACAAQAAAEGVMGREAVIEGLVQSAIDSTTVKTAVAQRYWREVYVGAPHGDGVLEGYIDLLYDDGGELVIVDYKTDAWGTAGDLDEKVRRYAVQLQAYADAVRETTSRVVNRGVLLFLSRDGAVAKNVDVSIGPFGP